MLLSSLFSSTPKIEVNRQESPRPDYAPSYGYATKSKERVTIDSAQSVATAYRAKNIISDDVAKMPFQHVRRVGRNIEQIDPDPVTRNMAYLLQVSPNEWGWTPFQFKKASMEWMMFYGNNYIWSPMVGPRQLLILPANRTKPVISTTDGSLWYEYMLPSGKPEYIHSVEILHLMINPDQTGFMGRGVITFARETLGRQLAANKVKAMMYSQGMLPAAIMQMNGNLSKEARAAVRAAYEEAMSGSENAYRLAVLDQKVTKFEAINMQWKDAQFLESIDATDRDICNFFGLPEHMLNRGKEAYNSNEQKYIEYLQGTLDSYLVAWEEAARIKWLTAAEQKVSYFKFVREALLRMSATTRSDVYAKLIQNAVMTPNEAREKEDRSGYEGGDQFFMNSATVPVDQQEEGAGNE